MSCLVELHFTSSGEYFKTLDQQQYITVNIKMYYKIRCIYVIEIRQHIGSSFLHTVIK